MFSDVHDEDENEQSLWRLDLAVIIFRGAGEAGISIGLMESGHWRRWW